MAKMGRLFDNRITIHQIHSLCDWNKHKRVQRYAMTRRKTASGKYRLKISGSSRFRQDTQRGQWYSRPATVRAVTNPPQAMGAALSDRQLGCNSRGVSSLLTVWWLPLRYHASAFSGCRGQIENAFYHKARCRAVYWSRAAYDPYLSFLMIMPDEAGQALGFFTCSWMFSAAWWQRSKKGLAPSLYGTIIRSYIENEGGAACWSIENLGMLASLFQNWMSRNTQHFLWIFKGQSFYH